MKRRATTEIVETEAREIVISGGKGIRTVRRGEDVNLLQVIPAMTETTGPRIDGILAEVPILIIVKIGTTTTVTKIGTTTTVTKIGTTITIPVQPSPSHAEAPSRPADR